MVCRYVAMVDGNLNVYVLCNLSIPTPLDLYTERVWPRHLLISILWTFFLFKCSFSLRMSAIFLFRLHSSGMCFFYWCLTPSKCHTCIYEYIYTIASLTLFTLIYDTFDHVYKNGLRCVECSNIDKNPTIVKRCTVVAVSRSYRGPMKLTPIACTQRT